MDRRVKEISALSYISTDVFNDNFYTYTISRGPAPGFLMTGVLSAVTGATTINCPAGRVLRENGKKLYPNTHSGVRTYMLGVYDTISGFKGFINPNDPMFAPYNTDRPNYQDDSIYTTDNTTKNLGPSVLTLGHITSAGDVTSPGQIVAAGQLRSSSVTIITTSAGTITLNPTLGQVFTLTTTLTGAVTLAVVAGSAAANPGAILYVMITNGGGRTFVGDGTTVVTTASATLASPHSYSITLVSDGATFREMSRLQYS